MLFQITHIDSAGHRVKAVVPASNVGDAQDQMDRQYGEPRYQACVRMAVKPSLHLVVTGSQHRGAAEGDVCAG